MAHMNRIGTAATRARKELWQRPVNSDNASPPRRWERDGGQAANYGCLRVLSLCLSLALIAFVLPACDRAGGTCRSEGNVKCRGEDAALLCVKGTWQEVVCRTGCENDVCAGSREGGQPCTNMNVPEMGPICVGGNVLLECLDGKWTKKVCKEECKHVRAVGPMCIPE